MVVKSLKNLVSKQKDYYFTLCTPAKIEYAISVIGISALAISCLTSGSGSKLEDTCTDIIPYILVCSIFVFILNALCKGGASIVSWIMVLCPLCALFVSVNNKAPATTEGFDATSNALKEFKDAMEEASEQFDSSRDDDEDYNDEDDDEDYDDDDEDEDYDEAEEMFNLSDMEFYEDQEPYNDDDMPQIKTKKNEYAAEKASKEEGAPQENFGVLDDLADVLEQKKDEAYNKIKAIGKLLRGDNEQFGNIKPASYYKY